MRLTSSSYDLSEGLTGARRSLMRLYIGAPHTVSNTVVVPGSGAGNEKRKEKRVNVRECLPPPPKVKEVMASPLFVCLSVCLFVYRISQKVC